MNKLYSLPEVCGVYTGVMYSWHNIYHPKNPVIILDLVYCLASTAYIITLYVHV